MPAPGLLQTCQRTAFSCDFSYPIFNFSAAALLVKLQAKTTGNLLQMLRLLLKAATLFFAHNPISKPTGKGLSEKGNSQGRLQSGCR